MEKEGFIRTVTRLDNEIPLRVVSTDRCIQIKKLMATDDRFNHLIHQFDPWHMAKCISKSLTKASKKKGGTHQQYFFFSQNIRTSKTN